MKNAFRWIWIPVLVGVVGVVLVMLYYVAAGTSIMQTLGPYGFLIGILCIFVAIAAFVVLLVIGIVQAANRKR